MTNDQLQAMRDLRAEGYAVIIWTPEELRGASVNRVQDRSIELGHQVIDDLADPDFDRPPMSQEEYLNDGGSTCPFCGSEDIESFNPQTYTNIAWAACECNSCHKDWRDEYTLTGYSIP